MTRHVVRLVMIAALAILFPPLLQADQTLQIGGDQVYIVNNAGAKVQFSLRPQGGQGGWSSKTLENGRNGTYGSAEVFEFTMSTDLKAGGKKTVNYGLDGGNRFIIYVNDTFYDLKAFPGSAPPTPISLPKVNGESNSVP